MHPVIRAIDVGFENTKYVTASGSDKIECSHFRSVAFHSARNPDNDGLGGRRRTAAIPLGGLWYEVGPDVELAAHRLRIRHFHDDYMETREYRALWSGALHFMKVDTVDVLVVGLPVADYVAKRAALEKALTGEFDVGRRRPVTVRRTLVVAQPQGALFHYASGHKHLSELAEQKNLVIDAGSRTFDWLVTRGLSVVPRLCHSVNRGVSDVLREIAALISHDLGMHYDDLEAIDTGLRTGRSPRIFQKAYDLRRFDPAVQEIAEQAVSLMLQHIDGSHAIENIVLVGGGAFMFRRAVKKAFPRHAIFETKDPLYANVRGFQMLGEKFARENEAMFASASAGTVTEQPSPERTVSPERAGSA